MAKQKSGEIIVGLDIGTTKICAIVGQVTETGIDIVGPLPPALQKITVFSASLSSSAPQPDAGKALIAFLSSTQAAPVMIKSGLDPRVK